MEITTYKRETCNASPRSRRAVERAIIDNRHIGGDFWQHALADVAITWLARMPGQASENRLILKY